MKYEVLLQHRPFETLEPTRTARLKAAFRESFARHVSGSAPFRRICEARDVTSLEPDFDWAAVPYLPVSVFKKLRLSSIDEQAIVRTVKSSATSTQVPSSIVLDDLTRRRQVRTLMWLMADLLGVRRRPFIIFDTEPSVGAMDVEISARASAIRGFLTVAQSATYCMVPNSDGIPTLDLALLESALRQAEAGGEPAVIMGYTYVLHTLAERVLASGWRQYSLADSTVIHIGGWKKLQDSAVSKDEFKRVVSDAFGVAPKSIIDIYGFTEQLGLVYFDCEASSKHCSAASEVLVRDPLTLKIADDGTEGLLEFLTPLPTSYPGIAVVVDDVGRIVGRGTCECGRNGTRFEVTGRARESELRGCGDVLGEVMAGAEQELAID